MTDASSISAAADTNSPRSQDDERSEWQLRVLKELVDLGLELARAIQSRALARIAAEEAAAEKPAGAAPSGDGGWALAFMRVNRAVRQTVALQAKLAEDRRTRAATAEQERRQQKKMRVKRSVARVIWNEDRPAKTRDWLDELNGRIEDLDDTDFGDRPIAEIVARICRDLGIAFDPRPWEAENEAIASAGDGAGSDGKAGLRSPPSAPSQRAAARPPPRPAATGSDPP
jgi:hypothetical protein